MLPPGGAHTCSRLGDRPTRDAFSGLPSGPGRTCSQRVLLGPSSLEGPAHCFLVRTSFPARKAAPWTGPQNPLAAPSLPSPSHHSWAWYPSQPKSRPTSSGTPCSLPVIGLLAAVSSEAAWEHLRALWVCRPQEGAQTPGGKGPRTLGSRLCLELGRCTAQVCEWGFSQGRPTSLQATLPRGPRPVFQCVHAFSRRIQSSACPRGRVEERR